jgi:hypothetical protein
MREWQPVQAGVKGSPPLGYPLARWCRELRGGEREDKLLCVALATQSFWNWRSRGRS